MPPQGAPSPGGSPIPPPLLALLAAAHAHAGGVAPPDEPDAGGSSGEQKPMAILKQMIDLGNQYIGVEPDAEDKATMAKLLATLHQYLAKDQQDAEAALGGGSATRTLRKLA